MKIIDGKGQGYSLEINKENKAMTRAVSISEVAHFSQEYHKTFTFATPLLTVTTTEGAMAWFSNSSTTESFIIERVIGSWNGDSTNHNQPCYVALCSGMTAPSANQTAGSVRNVNTNSSTAASALYYYWDEVGTGMTVASNGVKLGTVILAQGTQDLKFEGSIVIAPSVSLGITMQAEAAAGEGSIIVSGYYKEL